MGSRGPSQRLVRPSHISSHWPIFPHLERSFGDFEVRPGAPSRYESRGQRRLEKIDRDRIVDDDAQPSRGHRPAISAANSRIISLELAAVFVSSFFLAKELVCHKRLLQTDISTIIFGHDDRS